MPNTPPTSPLKVGLELKIELCCTESRMEQTNLLPTEWFSIFCEQVLEAVLL